MVARTPGGHLDWSAPTAMRDWQAECDAERALSAATGTTAMERACARFGSVARKGVFGTIKNRAQRFLVWPLDMVSIDERLPAASPRLMLAIAEHHFDLEARQHRRMMGFGGEIPLENARALLIAARWRRRFDRDDAYAVAAE